MSRSKCPVCGSETVKQFFGVEETMFRDGRTFEYAECSSCSSLYRTTVVQPHQLYPETYYSIAADPRSDLGSGVKKIVAALLSKSTFSRFALTTKAFKILVPIKELRTVCRMLESVHRASRGRRIESILDVGTGSGYLPFILSLAGKHVVGIDPFAPVEWTSHKAEVKKCEIEEINESFDLVMFHHSLEHVDAPAEKLKAAVSRLNPEGVIVIRVPKKDSMAWSKYGTSWFQIDAPRHEFVPTSAGLRRLIESADLSLVEQYDDSSSTQFWLSQVVQLGLAQMDEEMDFRSFRSDPSSILTKVRHAALSRKVNRLDLGDQTVCIARP